jgi:two-component system OmpR family response regulator
VRRRCAPPESPTRPSTTRRGRHAAEPAHVGGQPLRILIVEDEPAIAAAVAASLAAEGHAVDTIADGAEAITWAETYPYDLVVLDVILPSLDGFEGCRRLRAGGFGEPILMLTAVADVDARVTGLDHGADDYLAKPFAMPELHARVRALRRRQTAARSPRITVADLDLDPMSRSVHRAGRSIRLTAREFELLEVLARHPGRVFSQEQLIDAVWNADFDAESNIVEVYIRSLRRKLDGGRRDGLIQTVRGAGYRLHADPGTEP